MTAKPTWWQILTAILLLLIAGVGLIFLLQSWRAPETVITIAPLPTEAAQVTVYVGGAVANPGLYTLANGERIEAAIMAAGGFTADANPDGLNRAQRLRDEAQIVVPRKGDPTATPGRAPSTLPQANAPVSAATPLPKGSGTINVNTAGPNELTQLPGVGPKLAQAIVEYRTQHGPFSHALDLANVQGISERMALTWESLITFEPTTP